MSLLYPQPGETSPIDETSYTQPALFAVEYSLAELWRSWGIEPGIVLGHSVGEYVAACVAGVFSLEDGLRLIATRARLMQQLPRNGSMAVIMTDAKRVESLLAPYRDRVSIAAANGPENTVISGETAAVRELVGKFEASGLRTQFLTVSHAFHSPLMEPMLDEFERVAAEVKYSKPRIPIISNLTGEILSDTAPTAEYWRRHIRKRRPICRGHGNSWPARRSTPFWKPAPRRCSWGWAADASPELPAAWLPSLRKGTRRLASARRYAQPALFARRHGRLGRL